jgi:hypothetical protein
MDKGLLEESDIKVVGEGKDVFVEVDGVRLRGAAIPTACRPVRGFPLSPDGRFLTAKILNR